MANRFVTQNTSGTGDGLTAGNAWSLATFNGITTLTSADTVFFNGTFTGPLTTSSAGNATRNLLLDLTGATFSGGGFVSFKSTNFVTCLGGTFNSSVTNTCFSFLGSGNNSGNIVIDGAVYNGADDQTAHVGGVGWGVRTTNPNFGRVSNLTIQNCSFINMGGIFGSDDTCTNIKILNNRLQTNRNNTEQTDVIFLSDASNVQIIGNIITNRGVGNMANGRHDDCVQTFHSNPNGGGGADPTNWIVAFNWFEITETGGDGNNSGMMMEECVNMTIYGNIWWISPSVAGDSPNGPQGPDFNFSAGGNTFFYNNTIYANQNVSNACRFYVPSAPSNLFARNNIIIGPSGGTNCIWQYNVGAQWNRNWIFQGASSGTASITGPNGSTANPLLVLPSPATVISPLNSTGSANMALQATSPCLGAGDSTLGAPYNQGIAYGATWPNPTLVTRPAGAWDVGAMQFISGGGGGGTIRPSPDGQSHMTTSTSAKRAVRLLVGIH